MKTRIWLTITRGGVLKMTSKAPALAPGQRAIRLAIEVPDSAFDEPPTLDAELHVPADALAYPKQAEAIAVEVWNEP